jgi:hypothetical protein
MAEWVEGCKVEYVKNLLLGARAHAKYKKDEGGELLERGLRALYELSKKEGRDKFIPAKRILELAGIRPNQTITAGLWNWLDEWGVKGRPKFGAGIVEKAEGHDRKYRIRKEFYQAVEQVLSECVQEI